MEKDVILLLKFKTELSNILSKEWSEFKNLIQTKDYIFSKSTYNDTTKDPYTMSLYRFMFFESVGILKLIDGLFTSINVNTLDTEDNILVNQIILASMMRSTLEESAQIRYIFFKENKKSLVFDTKNLKPIIEATVSIHKKTEKLIAVFEDNTNANFWCVEVSKVGKLIRTTLPKEYFTLYKKLCNYSHNSKMCVTKEDTILLLLDLINLILPLIYEFNKLYTHYFSFDIDSIKD